MKRETLFLPRREALASICRDFRRYEPQILVFCQVIRLLSGGKILARRERDREGAWISVPGRETMRWMEGPDLREYLCRALKGADPDPETLAEMCARVFHTRVYPEVHAGTGRTGVRIETGMEDFACRQCGRCCRSLDYHEEVTAEDVAAWEALGRTDILQWVGVIRREGREPAYRIWTVPGTMRVAEVCPFLEEVPSENRWICRIHDAKPGICRQYPASRKHALMTGCPGFERGG